MEFVSESAQNKKLWYLKRINVFSGLSLGEMRELKRITRMVSYRKNEIIYLPGDPSDTVFLLKKGRVKISRLSEEGREATMAILDPGEIFGELEALQAVPRESLVQALEPVMVCEIRREDFDRYLHQYPEVGGRVIKWFGGRLRQIETRVSDLVFKSASARLAQLLLDLSHSMGIRENGSIRLQSRLTHQNLANLIGTSRETVSTLISQFVNHGLIAQDNRYILVLDEHRLAKVK
jgi:CRP-like cAMP-binding protein